MENSSDETKRTQQQQQGLNLKHLGFVRVAVINTVVWLSGVYDYAKKNSGPLRSAVGAVEGAVTTVVSPVCDKFKDVPDHVLVFLDQKVDVASAKFDEHAPPLAKQVANQLHLAIERTAQLAKGLIHQAQVEGPLAAARYAAEESKDIVLNQSVKAWSKLDQISPFHTVAGIAVPTAAHWSEKYNNLVTNMRGKGYGVFCYVPLIPSDEIAKAFKQHKTAGDDTANQPATEVSSQ